MSTTNRIAYRIIASYPLKVPIDSIVRYKRVCAQRRSGKSIYNMYFPTKMAPDPSGGSPSDMTDHVDNRGKALLTPIPSNSQAFLHTFAKNYSDKNGNDVTRDVRKGRRTFVFWILVFLLLVTAVGNLVLTFSILGVLRLGSGE